MIISSDFLTAIKPKVVYTNPNPSQSGVPPLYRVLTKKPVVGSCVSCLHGCFHHIGCTLFADPTSIPEVYHLMVPKAHHSACSVPPATKNVQFCDNLFK